ncbi:MAG: nitroreductase, partial [Bacteroidetes bacterium]|nr:nitroreductase [Bacteroidota bacterium]
NMWLSCTSYGIGSYWSSPSSITKANEFLQLQKGERCLGLFYMGYIDGEIPEGKRESMEEKVRSWKPA